jgi:hypothetical protein
LEALKMNKIIIVLLICFVAVGLIFGCTETTNTNNTNNGSGNVVTQPDNTNDGAETGGSTDSEIPMPPALPE